MTDDEVKDFLYRRSAERVAHYQKRTPGSAIPSELPSEIDGDIRALVWYVGAKPSRDDIFAAGATTEQVDAALADLKICLGIIEASDIVAIPTDLASEVTRDLQEALAEEPEGHLRRLDERWIKSIAEARVEIYSNEGQHRGRPHVVVILADGKVSVSLDDPPVLLTPHGYRGEASALKVVAKHRTRLRQIWDETRPDDQRLPTQPPSTS